MQSLLNLNDFKQRALLYKLVVVSQFIHVMNLLIEKNLREHHMLAIF